MKNILLFFFLLISAFASGQVTDGAMKTQADYIGLHTFDPGRTKTLDYDIINNKKSYADMVTVSGTNTYTYSTLSGFTSLPSGFTIPVKFTNGNTAASTLTFNGTIGPINLVKGVSTALASGDIIAGKSYTLYYDGTNLQVSEIGAGTVTSVTSADGNATIANTTTTPVITIVSAPKFQTGITLSITGDIAYTSPSFDGTGNVTAAGTVNTASPTVSGKTKLYTTTGTNTDGTMDQNSITSALSGVTFALTNGSGTTANSTAVDLGGTITTNTTIESGANSVSLTGTSGGKTNTVSYSNSGGVSIVSSGAASSEINFYCANGGTNSSIDLQPGAVTFDGAKYELTGGAASVPTNASITTKQYVTTAITNATTTDLRATLNYVAKTANYTLTTSDFTVNVTSGTNNQTLPTAVGRAGRMFFITNSGTGVVTVLTTSSQTFANVSGTPTSITLNQFDGIRVQSNGANWLKMY
jgi:hypothetical protein